MPVLMKTNYSPPIMQKLGLIFDDPILCSIDHNAHIESVQPQKKTVIWALQFHNYKVFVQTNDKNGQEK